MHKVRVTAKRGTVRFSREENQPRFQVGTNLGELLKDLKKAKRKHVKKTRAGK